MSKIQKLILGTVQFGLDYGVNNKIGKPDKKAVTSIFLQAYDAGIRTLDTAEAYGNAHAIIGQFHLEHPDQKFQIITKLPHDVTGSIVYKVDEYLSELHVDVLDILMFHSFTTYYQNATVIDEMMMLKLNGKIKFLGVSIYTNDELLKVIEDDRIDVIQLPFNLFDNFNKRGSLLKLAKEKGKIIHSRSAFLQGLFFKDLHTLDRLTLYCETELKMLKKIATNSNISVASLALNYVLGQNDIDQVLIGVDSEDQLHQNILVTDHALEDHVINLINQINIKNEDVLNPSKWNQLKQS